MNKSMKQTKPVPLTEEERKDQILRFLGQKRESFIQGILFNLCSGKGSVTKDDGVEMVDVAVAMADHLMETLYPVSK